VAGLDRETGMIYCINQIHINIAYHSLTRAMHVMTNLTNQLMVQSPRLSPRLVTRWRERLKICGRSRARFHYFAGMLESYKLTHSQDFPSH
jgi:hypothetical protein